MLKKILNVFTKKECSYVPLDMTDISDAVEKDGNMIYTVKPVQVYNTILDPLSREAEILLMEKGFATELSNNVSEKIVLLITEISELADCIKKGRSEKEIGLELADIVIRSCNFLLAFENRENIIYINNNLDSIFSKKIDIKLKLSVDIDKYKLIHHMHLVTYELMELLPVSDKNVELKKIDSIKMLEKIIVLTALCMAFAEMFCNEFLQYYINSKMYYNFSRPYKYNTVEECR